ncbi:aluminum-activated malate transporter 2-like [Papaver somniferum]|uniref:aluminum-activated malate transporter 2-like n=1 Tax=Papaver somniferum TaxID=3469 RepID=UPI000E6FD63F|nr:aluminum-activated malate transporter 2-like [Papaver somniferum]
MDISEPAANRKNAIVWEVIIYGWCWLKALAERYKKLMVEFKNKVKKVGTDDPRRVTHSLKVGVALLLVSLIYYDKPLYGGFGSSTMWAVLTVVVVFEFRVGATLSKGINRVLATSVAGSLGLVVHHLACLTGDKVEPVLLCFSVFLLAAASTFTRFFPGVKARYDYGMVIFILTFSLVAVSAYKTDEILPVAGERLITILIGCVTCAVISIFLFPAWAGEDLHKLMFQNIEQLAVFLDGFGGKYFGEDTTVVTGKKSFLEGYKKILSSMHEEEALTNFARWEPPHGSFQFGYPWKHYLKIGKLTRRCAYRIEELHNCITSKMKAQSEFIKMIQDSCMDLGKESGITLQELSAAVKQMTYPKTAPKHIKNLKMTADNLKAILKMVTLENANVLEDVMSGAMVASLLVDIVGCIEDIAESIIELAHLAKFKGADPAVRQEKLSQQLGNIKVHL